MSEGPENLLLKVEEQESTLDRKELDCLTSLVSTEGQVICSSMCLSSVDIHTRDQGKTQRGTLESRIWEQDKSVS